MARGNSRDGGEINLVLHRAVGTRARRWLLAVTVGLGVLAAAAVPMDPAMRSFAGIAGPLQQLMSVTLPFVGVLLVHDLRRAPASLRSTLGAAGVYATGIALLGALLSAAALALAPPGASVHPWQDAVVIGAGGVLVQVVAQLTGTACGLLLRSPAVACVATLLPMAVWGLLGLAEPLHFVRDYLTPFGMVVQLLGGTMTALSWAMWPLMFLIWGVGLNFLGVRALRREVVGQSSTRTEVANSR
ncbi:hypothetical protein [Pilimelia columellifera]|uniref:Uncharacterized protein n=1 Tax=Pilimelia columellifera subsp. columellifera TaxID=706583 RepID=A0ABN3NQJ4_9ACTN